jgi:digeranylgeranylglycerophospholipid reductase
MKKLKYDVVVVGGRIGGSVSSLFASKNKANVLMIEKMQEIGTPVQCAGGVTDEVFKTLQMKPSDCHVTSRIEGADVYVPDGRRVRVADEKTKGYILERKMFDKHLAIESAKAGTDIMVKTRFKDLIMREGKVCGVVAEYLGETVEVEADLVIAADGVESTLARKAGLNMVKIPEKIFSCAQYEVVGLDVPSNWLKFYFGEQVAPGGYAWIFPKGDKVANVGLGVRGTKETAYTHLKRFVSRVDATPVELNVGGIPVSGPVDKTFADGLLVVGDAAGQVDPLTGGGIRITAVCGRIAGEIAAEAVKTGNASEKFLKRYEDIWKEKIGKNLVMSLKYRKVLDTLTDEDMNRLGKFAEEHDVMSISKISALKFVGKNPHLLRLLKEIL